METEDALKWKRYKICEKMGWSLGIYNRQPASWIDEIWAFMVTEAKAAKDKQPNG